MGEPGIVAGWKFCINKGEGGHPLMQSAPTYAGIEIYTSTVDLRIRKAAASYSELGFWGGGNWGSCMGGCDVPSHESRLARSLMFSPVFVEQSNTLAIVRSSSHVIILPVVAARGRSHPGAPAQHRARATRAHWPPRVEPPPCGINEHEGCRRRYPWSNLRWEKSPWVDSRRAWVVFFLTGGRGGVCACEGKLVAWWCINRDRRKSRGRKPV